MDALCICATVTLELRFDPVDGLAVPIGSLTPVAELGQAPDRRLIPLQIEAAHERLDRLVWRLSRDGL
jgi:hypothetical protein